MAAAPRSRLINPLLGMYFGIFSSLLAAIVLLLMMLEQLGVTDAQSAAWNAYTGAVKARVSAMEGTRESMKQAMRSGTAVARMDAHIKAMEGMTESLKALKPATEAFYAVLTPEQKQKADALLGTGAMMCTFNTP